MFGQDRVTSDPAEAAYDAVYLWKAACEKAGSFEVDDVLDAIHTGEISFDAPEGTVTINGENQHLAKPVRIGQVSDDGLIYEVYSTDGPVDPDPYGNTALLYTFYLVPAIRANFGLPVLESGNESKKRFAPIYGFEQYEEGTQCKNSLPRCLTA